MSVFASLGSVTYGYDLGVIAQAIASPSFKAKFGDNPDETYVLAEAHPGPAKTRDEKN